MKLIDRLAHTKAFEKLKRFTQSVHLGRRKPIPLHFYLKILFKKVVRDDLNGRAMSVAFSLTLSIFPTILFFLSLLPYIHIDHQQILFFLANALPHGIYEVIDSTVSDILVNKRQNLLSFSVLFALYAATNGMATLIISFNRTYKYAEKRSFLRLRLVALSLTMVVGFMLIVAVAVLIVGKFLLQWLSQEGLLTDTLLLTGIVVLKYVVVFMVFFLS
ncbi:MAG: YihY/virulence factor BrkB family protein, partial [Bacteroidota bacterium]